MEKEIDLSNIKFALGMPGYGMIPAETMISVVNSIREFDRIGINLSLCFEFRNSLVDSARNNVVDMFLNHSEADKLIFIDSDMCWKEEALIRLCCLSSMYPVVGAMYSTKIEGDQKFLGMHALTNDNKLILNEHGLLKMVGCGLGFMVIDRSVFDKMKDTTVTYSDGKKDNIYRFFQTDVQNGKLIGEDIYFLKRWSKEFGGEVWIDPDINPGHVGFKVYRGILRNTLNNYMNNPELGFKVVVDGPADPSQIF